MFRACGSFSWVFPACGQLNADGHGRCGELSALIGSVCCFVSSFSVFHLHICLSREVAQKVYLKAKDAKAHTQCLGDVAQVRTQSHSWFALHPQACVCEEQQVSIKKQ